MCDTCIKKRIVEALGMRDEDLPRESPAPVACRPGHHAPAERLPDKRQPEHPELARCLSLVPGGAANEREPRDAVGGVERENDGPQSAYRVRDHVDSAQIEGVNDVAKEGSCVTEEVDVAVIEGICQSVTGAVDGEYAVVASER
jgi:hypothetical protein